MSFFTGFGVSALIYIILNILFPAPGSSLKQKFEEVDLSDYHIGDSDAQRVVVDDTTSSVLSVGQKSEKEEVVLQQQV